MEITSEDDSKMPAVLDAACDPGEPGAEKTAVGWVPNINNCAHHRLTWAPQWPSTKHPGALLKEYMETTYAEWRKSMGEGFTTTATLVADFSAWPYHFVIDFKSRIPAYLNLTGFDAIIVIDPPAPHELTDEQWHAETQRVLRTLKGPEVFVTSDGGAILSKSCIVALVEELHKRAFAGADNVG